MEEQERKLLMQKDQKKGNTYLYSLMVKQKTGSEKKKNKQKKEEHNKMRDGAGNIDNPGQSELRLGLHWQPARRPEVGLRVSRAG